MNIKQYTNKEKLKIKSCYKKVIDKDFSMWPHSHEYLEVMEVLSGTIYLDIFINKALIQTLEVKSNTAILISSNAYHRIRTSSEANITNIEFEVCPINTHPYIQTIPYLNNSVEWNTIFKTKYGINTLIDINGIEKSIDSIINRVQKVGMSNNDIYTDALIMHLFIKLSESYKVSTQITDSGTFHFNKAFNIIKREIGNNISIKTIAKELGITVSYLERLFKEAAHMTVKKYISNLKMDLIKDLLITTDEPLASIAKKYGFSTISQLEYQFKQVTNMTPRKYKEKYSHTEPYENNFEYKESTFETKE